MSATIHLNVLDKSGASVPDDLLRRIHIASPCSMSWDEMTGDDRRRHCAACDLDVHNFAAMTRDEIETLVRGANGRLCGRLFRRADGTILTADCPVGLAAVRARARRALARSVAAMGFAISACVLLARGEKHPWQRAQLEQLQPFKWVNERLGPPPQRFQPLGGLVCVMPTPAERARAEADRQRRVSEAVERLETHMARKDYDAARMVLEGVLFLDPHNETAIRTKEQLASLPREDEASLEVRQ